VPIPKRSETPRKTFPPATSESSKVLDLDTPNREGLIDHIQKMTVAAIQMADMNV
jgi:hypothetical protein